jgi:hypothetical protein
VASSANGSSSLTSPRCPATSVTGMPSRRSSAGSGAHRQHPRTLHHRCRLSQPQRPARSQVQDLHKRPNRRITPRIKRESNGGPPSSQSLQGDITAWAAASPRQASTSPTPHSLPPAKIALKPSSSRCCSKREEPPVIPAAIEYGAWSISALSKRVAAHAAAVFRRSRKRAKQV